MINRKIIDDKLLEKIVSEQSDKKNQGQETVKSSKDVCPEPTVILR